MVLSAAAYFLLKYRTFLEGPSHWDVFLCVYLSCVLLSLAVGTYVAVVQSKVISADKVYFKWDRQANCLQKGFQYLITGLTFLNFKIVHVLWCGIKSLPLL